MAAPLIFIFKTAIRDGKLEEYGKFLQDLSEFVEAKEPRLIAQEIYVSEDGTEATGVLIHPDAEAMELHLQLLAEWSYEEFLETKGIEICGELSEALRNGFAQYADAGMTVSVRGHLGGFNRLPA